MTADGTSGPNGRTAGTGGSQRLGGPDFIWLTSSGKTSLGRREFSPANGRTWRAGSDFRMRRNREISSLRESSASSSAP